MVVFANCFCKDKVFISNVTSSSVTNTLQCVALLVERLQKNGLLVNIIITGKRRGYWR
jgi:hypothetical protein